MKYIFSPKDIRESRGVVMLIADTGYPIVDETNFKYFVKTEVSPEHEITKIWAMGNRLYIKEIPDDESIEIEDEIEYKSKEYWENAYWNLKKEYNRMQRAIKDALNIR